MTPGVWSKWEKMWEELVLLKNELLAAPLVEDREAQGG